MTYYAYRKRLSDSEKAQRQRNWLQLIQEGATAKQIAQETGYSLPYVYEVLNWEPNPKTVEKIH